MIFDITSDDDNPDFLDEVNIDEFVEPTTTPFESQTVQNALNSSYRGSESKPGIDEQADIT